MKHFTLLIGLWSILATAQAQVDTITTANTKLDLSAWREGKATYAVFFEDSTGNRLSSADLWDRRLRRLETGGETRYEFIWDWYHQDSLRAHVVTNGWWPSLAPLTHQTNYPGRGQRSFVFEGNRVSIPPSARRTAKDSLFKVETAQAAFAFSMDLEVLPRLPLRRVGQQFAIAFYEPGSPASAYYKALITARQPLSLPGQVRLDCWVLRLEYAPGVYAQFWISEKPREVIKMQDSFRGRYRTKVKLY